MVNRLFVKNMRDILRRKQAGLCCYCRVRLRPALPPRRNVRPHPESETLEHLLRLVDGGKNNPDNLALSCFRCNYGRGDIDWFTYASYRRGELFGEAA